MNEIIGLAPIIGEVSRIFESLSNWMGITKEDVAPLYDYLQKAPSPMDFEKLIVDVVAAMPDAESNPILSGIAANLDSIVRLFLGPYPLSQSDPSWLWKKELADLNRQIEDQAPLTKDAKDFYEAKKREYYDYLQRDDCDYV